MSIDLVDPQICKSAIIGFDDVLRKIFTKSAITFRPENLSGRIHLNNPIIVITDVTDYVTVVRIRPRSNDEIVIAGVINVITLVISRSSKLSFPLNVTCTL